mgnify:CR=1 FL=1
MEQSSFTVVKDGETYNMPMKNYQYPNELGFEAVIIVRTARPLI